MRWIRCCVSFWPVGEHGALRFRMGLSFLDFKSKNSRELLSKFTLIRSVVTALSLLKRV